jgi:hypothetical protein
VVAVTGEDHAVESITVPVPPAQIGAARHVLRRLFDVKAEALHRASEALLDAPNVVDKLLAHRDELLEIDALLDEIGWRDETPEGPVELSGNRALIDELTRMMVIDAVEALHDFIDISPAATVHSARIRVAIEHLLAVLSLFDATQHANA